MNKPDALDTLLRAHPVVAPSRTNLVAQTLQLAIQAKRIRLVRRWLAVAAALAFFLLLAKWADNGALYLIQLAFTKAHLVRDQASLYSQAVWESLPKAQAATIMAAVVLWLAWRWFETSLLHPRITSVKQGHLMKLISLAPRLTVTTALLSVAALGVSGYTYAQKASQPKLEILRTQLNQTGRTEVQTNGTTATCAAHPWTNETASFEVKSGVNLSSADIKRLATAACLQASAEAVVSQKYTPNSQYVGTPIYRIEKRRGNNITLLAYYGGQANHHEDVLASDTTVFDLTTGTEGSIKDIAAGSIIMPLAGTIIVLPSDPGIESYDPVQLRQLTRITLCSGNPADRCSFTGSIDFFPSGGGEANAINQSLDTAPQLQSKEIAGTIMGIAPTYTKIKSSSGRLFTINFGSDPAADFNRTRSVNYQGQQVEVGDTLLVRYVEAAGQHNTIIAQNHIINAVLMLEIAEKSSPLKKY